jgi:hypothetical protein
VGAPHCDEAGLVVPHRSFKGSAMATSDPRDDSALQYALEELETLVIDNDLARSEIMALLEVMNIYEVLDYLDAKISNRLQ